MYIGCIQKVSLKKYDKCELQLKCEGISEFYKGMSITRTQSMWSFKQWSNEICIQLNHRVFPHLQKFSGSPRERFIKMTYKFIIGHKCLFFFLPFFLVGIYLNGIIILHLVGSGCFVSSHIESFVPPSIASFHPAYTG